MNHKIHLWLTSVFLLTVNSVMGAITQTPEIPEPFTTQTIDKTGLAGYTGAGKTATGLFANGHAIIIEEGTAEGNIKVTTTDLPENVSVELPGATTVVFGGKYNDDCETTNITIKSGTVYSIVGGGYGTSTEQSADVTTSTINLDGGTVTRWVIGGGAYYSTTETANINAKGEGTPTVNSWMIGCIESGVIKGGEQYPEYAQAPCRVGTMNLDIKKGTYWIIALAGGNGDHSFTKTGNATIKGTNEAPVIIEGGLFGCGSNGRGESATATVEYCDLSAEALELASVNRGKLETVDFTFKNCTFSDKIYAYLGGTYRWGDGYASSAVGVPQKVKFTFDPSCTNIPSIGISEGLEQASVELNGAKGKIAIFDNGKNANNMISAFTIGEGKTWTFNDGLEMTGDVTLTQTGTLVVKGIYTVATADQLKDATQQAGVTDIQLSKGDYELTDLLELSHPLTLSSADPSNKATIKGYIAIKADGVSVKDLNLSYERKSALFSQKNGISVFANKATLTGNTFTTTGDGTNGIVFYPVGSGNIEQSYTVTGNTFNLAGASSTGIIVRENFASKSQIPDVATTASLSNGPAFDQQIIASDSKNTFDGSMTGGYYVRVTGNYSEKDGTGEGSEDISQQYLYSYVNAENVAEAIVSSRMGATVNASDVASGSLVEKMNTLATKKALADGIHIICSDGTIYTDLAGALAATTVGNTAKYLAFIEGTYELKEAQKETPTIAAEDLPEASEIEVGYPLSASLLRGGTAKINDMQVSGVFTWETPNDVVNTTGSHTVIFTPTNQTLYNTVTASVEVKAIQYYIVTIGKCENGKVEIVEGANPANKYKKDHILKLKAIPAAHYKFSQWGKDITETYTVANNASLTAEFTPIMHTVTFGDNITVLNAGTAISSGDEIAEGSILTVTAAKDGSRLTSLTSNDNNILNNQVSVDQDIKITATFETLQPSTRLVKIGNTTKNGKVKLYDENGNIIEAGSAVIVGKTVSIEAVPDYGYTEKDLSVSGATLNGNKFEVTASDEAITVTQTFEKETFGVTLPTEDEHATVTLTGATDLNAVAFETSLTIASATASDGYKLITIVVNGREVTVGGTFTVTADTKVNAVVQKLPAIQFTDTEQSTTYDAKDHEFVIRTIPANISDITISYENVANNSKPQNAGIYKVYATYNGDDYAKLNKKEIGSLTINKAQWTGAAVPETGNVKEEASASEGEYYWGESVDENFQKAHYKLTAELSKNYETPTFIIPKADKTPNTITLNTSTEKRSRILKSGDPELKLTGENGSIAVYNGPAKVEGSAYEGQRLTLKAIPDVGYSSIPTWNGTNITDNGDGTATIILAEGTVTATFKKKEEAPIETKKTLSRTYNGVIYGDGSADLPSVIDSKVSGWALSIKKGDWIVEEPTDADSYDIVASRQEDDVYATTTITIGALHIAQAKPELKDVKGSEIQQGLTLNESIISGTSNVAGTFSWKNPATKMNTEGDQKALAVFKSDNSNYEDSEVEAIIHVKAKSTDITTRTLTLSVKNPEYGETVVIKLNNTEFTGSTSVKEGDIVNVTFKANTNCTASATINGQGYTSGTDWKVPAKGDVDVQVVYAKEDNTPDEPGDPDEPVTPDAIAVTGIKLDATSKTLAVGESFTLKATVEPANADNKKVRWSSSNSTIASVDKDGKVQALQAGTCKITVTTDDGDYTADCEITVSIATGIDEILAANRIYSESGQIIIEPTASLEVWITDMTGKIVYRNRITDKTQVTVYGGLYLVRLVENDKMATVKVIVK